MTGPGDWIISGNWIATDLVEGCDADPMVGEVAEGDAAAGEITGCDET